MDKKDREDPETNKGTKWTRGRLCFLTTDRQNLVMVGDSAVKESHWLWMWGDFRVEFENQFYLRYHRKMKE